MRAFALAFSLLVSVTPLQAVAQWQLQDAHITADLRGIDSLGNGVAWASGSAGTVLRTEDAGFVWQLCATPPGAEKLDFRGVRALSNDIAFVMSSGKGELSRLYRTTDGCQTWQLLLTNPDKDGFWDALAIPRGGKRVELLGDPVNGKFAVTSSPLAGVSGERVGRYPGPPAQGDEGAFAASNTSVLSEPDSFCFVTGGPSGAGLICGTLRQPKDTMDLSWTRTELPLAAGRAAGGFSIAAGQGATRVVVGGDYTKPALIAGTSAFSSNGGKTWNASQTPPGGYRSAVAYDEAHNSWITVGPNGTDLSLDNGRTWRALKPSAGEVAEADQHWNALSLPFVVGPHGRIGVLRPEALPTRGAPQALPLKP